MKNGSPEAAVQGSMSRDAGSVDRLDLGGLLALRAILHFELDLLVLLEGLEAAALDFGEVGEEVFAAAVRLDEAEALRVIEPLDGTGAHCISLLLWKPGIPPGGVQRLKERKETWKSVATTCLHHCADDYTQEIQQFSGLEEHSDSLHVE